MCIILHIIIKLLNRFEFDVTDLDPKKFFLTSLILIAYPKKPLQEDLPNLSESIKTLFIYGEDTWMNKKSGYDTAQKLKGGAEYVEFPGGHHVYAESHE